MISVDDEYDEDEALSNLRHFAALAPQLARLVFLHATNAITWTPLHRQDPAEREQLFDKVAKAINSFGGASEFGDMDVRGVASLFATLQSFDDTNPLPLSAMPTAALNALLDRCWSPPGDDGKEWKDRLRRLAYTAVFLGNLPPTNPAAAPSNDPSSWLVWRRDRSVTPSDISDARIELNVPAPPQAGPQPYAGTGIISESGRVVVRVQVLFGCSPEPFPTSSASQPRPSALELPCAMQAAMVHAALPARGSITP